MVVPMCMGPVAVVMVRAVRVFRRPDDMRKVMAVYVGNGNPGRSFVFRIIVLSRRIGLTGRDFPAVFVEDVDVSVGHRAAVVVGKANLSRPDFPGQHAVRVGRRLTSD